MRKDKNYLDLQVKKLEEIINKDKKVIEVAEEFKVSRKTIHIWLIRYKRFGIDGLIKKKKVNRNPAHNKTRETIENIVIDLANKYFCDGVETLHDLLLFEHQIDLHSSTIFRILKRRNVRYDNEYHQTQRYKKIQLYSLEREGQEVQVDTKYPFGYGVNLVIYTAIDDATRIVYALCYQEANAINTIDFLNRLQKKLPFNIQKIRNDQGTEFKNLKVKKFMKDNNIIWRNNTPYSPEENGKIERFHRTLNDKFLRYGVYPKDSLDTFNYKLTLFLFYYNNQKKHRGLGMNSMTPVEKLNYLRQTRQKQNKV